jgi:putative acetyltransferase
MVTTEADLPADEAGYLEFLRTARARKDGVWIVAADGERVIGQVTLARLRATLVRHVALLGIQVHPEAQGRGLGRALMERAIAWAASTDVLRIELYVRADNERARRLYASLGFVVEGVRRDFVRLPDGTFVDDLVMARRM